MNGEMDNPWEQMLLVGEKKMLQQISDPKKQQNYLATVSLLNALFNNSFKYNDSFKKSLLNYSTIF